MRLIANMGRLWLRVFFIVCVTGIFFVLFISSFSIYRTVYRPMIQTAHGAMTLEIDKAMSASSFVHLLLDKQLIQSGPFFLAWIRLQGLSHQLKAGIYRIAPGESAQHFLHRVTNGDVLKESFCLVEGTTQVDVSKNLQHAPYLIYNDSDWSIIKGSFNSAEGLLLADTYYYNAGSQGKNVLVLAHMKLVQCLEEAWQHRSPDLPYKTSYELLIAASILEKEAAIPREKRLISGIIINRLRKNMPLQMDPTVIYALGSTYQGKLTRDSLRVDSPYNSYRYRGLPPTPIAMVGKDAIDAAAHPEKTDYLYFVATGNGGHYFSVNYDQQKQAVARYRH